jgi:hypothetical protein
MMGKWNCSGPTDWRVRRKLRRFSGPERWFAHLAHSSQDPHSYLVRASARSSATLKSCDTKSFYQ